MNISSCNIVILDSDKYGAPHFEGEIDYTLTVLLSDDSFDRVEVSWTHEQRNLFGMAVSSWVSMLNEESSFFALNCRYLDSMLGTEIFTEYEDNEQEVVCCYLDRRNNRSIFTELWD